VDRFSFSLYHRSCYLKNNISILFWVSKPSKFCYVTSRVKDINVYSFICRIDMITTSL
jgi:hypothetical protein